MPPAGDETLALWRETGEWWKGDPGRVVHRFIDASGKRRETVADLPPRQPLPPREAPRIRRIRDEKVSIACGKVPDPILGSGLQREMPGVALHLQSGYTYGRGTMIAAEIPAFAAERGYGAALLADSMSLTGVVEFWKTCEKLGLQALIGATFELPEAGEIVLVARNREGYRSLSRLVTECHLGEPRHFPLCSWERLERHSEGLLCLTGGDDGLINRQLIRSDFELAKNTLQRLVSLYGRKQVFVEIERSYLPWQVTVNRRLLQLAKDLHLTPVAGGPILHERPEHFPAHDVLVCVESLCLIDEVEGRKPRRDPSQFQVRQPPRRGLNAERYLRDMDEQEALFSDHPELLENAWRVADLCERNVLPGETSLPKFCDNEDTVLRQLTFTGAHTRYPTIDRALKKRINLELDRIIKNRFARHFLVAWDMCAWADSKGVLFSGRGSVVDSVVAYCLNLSRIDAFAHDLHFDRFLPDEGHKRPDIDIDFEAARREDVRQYLVTKYGDAHVATVAAVGTYRTRGIVREVGKVMGIPEESMAYLTKRLHGSVSPHSLETALDSRPELRDSGIPRERFHWVMELANQLMDLPRNIRSHSSGVVISSEPIADTVPVMWSGMDEVKIIQWDKRSAKRCFDKFDVLCLRGNDVLGETQRQVRRQDENFSVTNLPLNDENTFKAMQKGELVGIPQSASPAMRQAHIRIKTANLKDAGIVQAAIRPGVGGAVKLNEFVARRQGKQYNLIHSDLKAILDDTLGIVVFQEQIDQLLQTFGKYTSDEAEMIREDIYKQRRAQFVERIREEVIAKIIGNGYTPDVAKEVYELVAGFNGYGFAQGHALAFAEISIRSIWCQQNFPSQYFAALLSAQPAGYYGPCTIANEARRRGVTMLQPDVNRSQLIFALEDTRPDEDIPLIVPNGSIRIALRQIGGISETTRLQIISAREKGSFQSYFDFVARVELPRDELERLILCGALDSLADNRRAMLWSIPRAYDYARMVRSMKDSLPLYLEDPKLAEGVADFSPTEKAIFERDILGLDVKRHLMDFERERVREKGGLTAAEASEDHPGQKIFVVGNPIRLRFPPTVSGRRVMFFDLEDESGLLNVTCFDDVYQRDGHKVICHPYITLWGETQCRDGHVGFLAHRIYPYTPSLTSERGPLPIVTADFLMT